MSEDRRLGSGWKWVLGGMIGAAAMISSREESAGGLSGGGAAGRPPVAAAPRGPGDALRFTRFRDPVEGCFEVEVPEGWAVRGGLVRRSAVEVRGTVRAASPDGAIRVFFGDADLPTFTVPTRMLEMSGCSEGRWYSPGYGVRMFVKRLEGGLDFASEYAATRLVRGAADLRFTERRPRPDLAEAINRIQARFGGYGIQARLDIGEVAFTCAAGGRPLAGYVLAGTHSTLGGPSMGNIGIWSVEQLYGFLAPPERAAEAQAILGRMAASFRID